jgi:hypothetical protein
LLNRSSCLAPTSGVTKYMKINCYLLGHTMSYLSLSDLGVKLTRSEAKVGFVEHLRLTQLAQQSVTKIYDKNEFGHT